MRVYENARVVPLRPFLVSHAIITILSSGLQQTMSGATYQVFDPLMSTAACRSVASHSIVSDRDSLFILRLHSLTEALTRALPTA